jgi:hypothetical protein
LQQKKKIIKAYAAKKQQLSIKNDCANTTIVQKVAGWPEISNMCGEGMLHDLNKKNNAVKVDGSDWKAQCCSKKAKCSDVTCPAGHLKKNDAPTECTMLPCASQECCEPDPTKCAGMQSMGKTCDEGGFVDPAKQGNDANSDTWKDSCCSALALCKEWGNVNLGTWNEDGTLTPAAAASPRQYAATLGLILPVVAAMSK